MNDMDYDHINEAGNNTASAIMAGTLLGDFKQNPDANSDIAAVVLVPAGMEVKEIERPAYPFRLQGFAKLDDVSSFIEYFKKYARPGFTNIYGRADPAAFTAIFNDHIAAKDADDCNPANWRDFGCIYTPKFSKEFSTWNGKNGHKFDGNEDFAVWLEDNLADVIEPSNGSLLELALNFKVNSNASFSNPIRLQNGNTEFNFTNAVEGSSQISGKGKVLIPEIIKIMIPVFQGRNAPNYEFQARFRYRLNGARLNIWYELIRPHKVLETAFNDMVDAIEDGTEQTILYGSP